VSVARPAAAAEPRRKLRAERSGAEWVGRWPIRSSGRAGGRSRSPTVAAGGWASATVFGRLDARCAPGSVGLGCGVAYSRSGSLQVTAIRRAGNRTMRQDHGAGDPYSLEAILLVSERASSLRQQTTSTPRSCWINPEKFAGLILDRGWAPQRQHVVVAVNRRDLGGGPQ
jgi:hypothetical protein